MSRQRRRAHLGVAQPLDRNWYLPKWLGWLPAVDVEGAPVPEPAPEPAVV